MGKGIILRVLEGIVLTPELSRTLDELLPGYQLKNYDEKPDYAGSISRRIQSLHDAFLFMLDAYPRGSKNKAFDKQTLKDYAEECKDSCDFTKKTVEELHKELEKYTAKLVETIATCWEWPKSNEIAEAKAALNEAEQYVLMQRGRPDLATLMPIVIGEHVEYALQYDESLPPYTEQFLQELEKLKSCNYPKTPSWFRNNLSEYQQAYFCNLDLASITPVTVIQDLNGFIVAWDKIKRESKNITRDLEQINNAFSPYPSWFDDLNKGQQAMIKELSGLSGSVDEHLAEFKSFITTQSSSKSFNDTLGNIAALPQWYWSLSRIQQYYLGHVLQTNKNVVDVVSFLSSRHRTLPVPANYAAHSLYKINKEGEAILLYGKRYRSSHIVSRDGLALPKAVQQRHSDTNFAKVMEFAKPGQLSLLQTLISPITAFDYMPAFLMDFLPDLPPDLELFKLARATVGRSERASLTLEHNHPFNIAKYWYYTSSTDKDSLLLLKKGQEAAASTPGLQELLDDYRNVLESPMGSATVWDYVGRELFLSSLEQLIVLHMGGHSYGSCVSGKDRKAVELMHTDAMILYKEKYGAWPKFGVPSNQAERINFINIFVEIYMTRHQHEHAGQNAPGSEGIKTPSWYLPKDISDAINQRLGTEKGLIYDDRLATDNEVKNISKKLYSYFLPENELLCKLTARQMGEALCTKLYDALTSLINEESRFQKKHESSWFGFFDKSPVVGPTPTGIRNIRGVMQDKDSGNDNVLRMEKIFLKVLERPETDSSRTKETMSIYGRIRDCLLPPFKLGDTLAYLAGLAIEEWTKLFEESKKINSAAMSTNGLVTL
ncbi:oxidoreductase [uncultured Legionella sp.]|uniref:oxidoreductase n=1 Tax=uncultured Legionella sp. TaxID=210934 RepID=UPI00261DD992|nr:oxidoreductase [uncultured Legionella sp.]